MSHDEKLSDLDGLLRGWERERDLSGAVLLSRGGVTVFEGVYGFADRGNARPVGTGTRFGLASVTKMFTAVAVVGLVNEGSLSFDTALVEVLPPDRRPATLRPDVTIHHLLCHTSGIADYSEEDEESPSYLADYGSLWRTRPNHRFERPADFLPLFGDLPPYRPPGERWQYSNAGYVLLGLALEAVTARAFTEVVTERVLVPAGMTASGFLRLDETHPDVAIGYLERTDPDSPWRTNIYSIPVIGGADGGAFSTARDLDRFLTAYSEGPLLGPLRELVLTRHAAAGDGFGIGYGVLLYPDGRIGHGGGDPGAEALIHRWDRRKTNLVVLCNIEGLVSDVRDAVIAHLIDAS